MTTIKSIFFDIGDTLGIPAFSPPPVRLVRVDLFFFVAELLRSLSDRGLRLGIISNTGDIDGASLDEMFNATGIRDFFDPALRLYSKDVGLEKNSPEIFRVAAGRAGLAATPQACLFVGEKATERGFASDAGFRTCPHPLLVSGVLDDQPLRFVRVTAPPATSPTALRAALRAQPLVALHVAGANGNVIYAMASQRTATASMNMQLKVDLLGNADQPARTDLYLLRDDVAVQSGFPISRGEAARFFGQPETSGLLVGSGADGVIVALPDGQSPGDFHFAESAPRPHAEAAGRPVAARRAPCWARLRGRTGNAGRLFRVDGGARSHGHGCACQDYAGSNDEVYRTLLRRLRPLSGTDPVRIRSRHLANLDGDNQRVVAALTDELEKEFRPGPPEGAPCSALASRDFTAQRRSASWLWRASESVLVTAHLDSTAADDADFDGAHGAAPGADDDASGVAAEPAAAQQFVALSAAAPLPRTVRFVLFNAEEEGLVGSRVYARQQKAGVRGSRGAADGHDRLSQGRSAVVEVHAGFAPSAQTQARSVAIAKVVQSVAASFAPTPRGPDLRHGPGSCRRPKRYAPFQDQGYPACVVSKISSSDRRPIRAAANPTITARVTPLSTASLRRTCAPSRQAPGLFGCRIWRFSHSHDVHQSQTGR